MFACKNWPHGKNAKKDSKVTGNIWAEGERPPVPESDFPAGLPAWMHEQDGWAKRTGADDIAKRRNITINVPKGVVA